MQSERSKRAEIAFRRHHYWSVGAQAEYFRPLLSGRRDFFSAVAMNGRLKPPILEIGAEYGLNGMILEGELDLPTICLDLSSRALQASTILSRLLGYRPPSKRIAADAERLPFTAGSFNTVLLWGALHHFDDPTLVLKEIWRVLAEDGALLIAEEPIKRRLSLNLGHTIGADRMNGISKLLLKMHLLPWFMHIGGRQEIAHEVTERDLTIKELEELLAGFESRELIYFPRLTGGAPAAGPLALWLWRNLVRPQRLNESLSRWFGGMVFGWMAKPRPFRALSPNRYIVRKHPNHDRIALPGFEGALLCDGQTLREIEMAILPESTKGKSLILLDMPRLPRRIDLWAHDRSVGLVSYHVSPSPREEPLSSLACPECVVFTEYCILGTCKTECVAACPNNALAPSDPVMPVRNSCDGCGWCLHACAYGGLERPVLVDRRCPECRTLFESEGDVLELRSRKQQATLQILRLETAIPF